MSHMGIPRFGASAEPTEVVAALKEHGCAIVEELVSPDVMAEVESELRPYIEETPFGADDFSGSNTRRTGALLARSRASQALIANPLVLAAVDGALWESKSSYQLHLTQAIAIGPGSEAQQIHRDHWCFDFFPFPPEVDVEVGTMWALTDFTEENGATRIVPDSHRTTGMPFTPADTLPAEMPAGSVVLYLGGCVHGGGANRSNDVRIGINVDYVLGWLRQEENQYLSVPHDIARELPEDIQRLMGYRLGAFALGYVDDVRDPIEVLRGEGSGVSTFAVR